MWSCRGGFGCKFLHGGFAKMKIFGAILWRAKWQFKSSMGAKGYQSMCCFRLLENVNLTYVFELDLVEWNSTILRVHLPHSRALWEHPITFKYIFNKFYSHFSLGSTQQHLRGPQLPSFSVFLVIVIWFLLPFICYHVNIF